MIQLLRNSRPNILVVGDLMIDHYLWGRAERISPEAPVQVVDVANETTVLGGAGNVINNLIALGASVSVASAIGDDANGKELTLMLKSIGVKTEGLVTQPGRKTSKKSRVIAANQQILRYDKESKDAITEGSEAKILAAVEKDLFLYDIIILSDYGKGVLTPTLAQGVITRARAGGKKVLVDPKGRDYTKYRGAHLLTPNKKEAIEATGIEIKDDESLKAALLWLKSECGLDRSMITLSEDGIAIFDEKLKRFPTVAQEVYDVTGAGDTVIASIAFALSSGLSIDDAARFANLAAGVVVGKIGSATVTLDEIEEYEAMLHQSSSDAHIKSFEEIDRIVNRCRAGGKRIVFTNGCFDILHVGHVKYLQVAKSFGDILIVGLNADASVRALKGPSRPVNSEDDRAYILAALESVDYVVKFGDDTPYELIKMLRPDVLVKGGDYEGKAVVGTEFAGELKLVDFVEGKSTTKTIARIQEGTTC
ncbi:D-glycero-beta-D-manno-heptose-7-phosphate kinase [Sulfurimonas sp. HSL-3221]|uniref:D-glycero-beta-D-manno-heptose-7-phosphate kinase n=1 Tax=Sulfurimonadaceae TaxID=2771471 RepID=UPI001E324919|nr:D-glycero-beta-D-manno-heptose-7-phosphate kinase [Sulfurimonas sp. HSL-3221]UFS62219.1 D-glycero-beta-D-manno-heptose-7-phosphate kinase [Sulfurimonas sp. HSL-3221]